MTSCICLAREEIGPSAPREYATWLVSEWQKSCPVHRDCEHEARGGMCWRCAPPGHLPSPEQIEANWARFKAMREGGTEEQAEDATDETSETPRRGGRINHPIGRKRMELETAERSLIRALRQHARRRGIAVALLASATRAEVTHQIRGGSQ